MSSSAPAARTLDDVFRPPFLDALHACQSVLLAGCGGGFDVYGALPLFFGLRQAGKNVHLASLSFVNLEWLHQEPAEKAFFATTPVVSVTADTRFDHPELQEEEEGPYEPYFPERALLKYLKKEKKLDECIWCFNKTGVKTLTKAYRHLCEKLAIDAIVLVDGGTDSLMRGDESGLGTPEEDMLSIMAVQQLTDIPIRQLACIAFGVDAFHGVCHADVLQATAELQKDGHYLGAMQLLPTMPFVKEYIDAYLGVEKMGHNPSIVTASVGEFGNYHHTRRTRGSRLFINPLMSMILPGVAERLMYGDELVQTLSFQDVCRAISSFRMSLRQCKSATSLPM